MIVREVPHPSMSGATTMVDAGQYIGTDGQVVSTPIPKITITGVSFGDLKDENAGSYQTSSQKPRLTKSKQP